MSKLNNTLSLSRLQELLDYDPETGIFTRKVATSNCVRIGDVAGCLRSDGYWVIHVNNRSYLSHRLAWFYTNGTWPEADIDHKNGDPSDNRIANLRAVSRSENLQNSDKCRTKNPTSRFRGVWRRNDTGKWSAQIKVAGQKYNLGSFDSEESASEAYQEARKHLHPFAPLHHTPV